MPTQILATVTLTSLRKCLLKLKKHEHAMVTCLQVHNDSCNAGRIFFDVSGTSVIAWNYLIPSKERFDWYALLRSLMLKGNITLFGKANKSKEVTVHVIGKRWEEKAYGGV